MQSKTMEFRHQSLTQKSVLLGLKVTVILINASMIHSLGWENREFDEQLRLIGNIFIGFWIYANLARVKIEVQELFVPPVNIGFVKELMLIGFALDTLSYFV